jgi:hypothetical protein
VRAVKEEPQEGDGGFGGDGFGGDGGGGDIGL